MIFGAFLLFIFITIQLGLMLLCLFRLNAQINFHYFNRIIWLFIIVFGNIIGIILYLFLERDKI